MIAAAIPPHLRRELSIIRELAPERLSSTFTAAELEEIALLSSKKGREERITSRAAAKILLAPWMGVLEKDVEIFSEDRRPRCRIAGVTDLPHLSLSHSGGWGAALVSGTRSGIDIELIRAIDPRAFKFYLRDDEIALLDRLGRNAAVRMWSAKEAAWKISNPITVKKISIERIDQWGSRILLRYRSPDDEGMIELFETGPLVVAVARSS